MFSLRKTQTVNQKEGQGTESKGYCCDGSGNTCNGCGCQDGAYAIAQGLELIAVAINRLADAHMGVEEDAQEHLTYMDGSRIK